RVHRSSTQARGALSNVEWRRYVVRFTRPDQIENPQRDHLGERPGIAHGTDACRTPVIAVAAPNERTRPGERVVMHLEQRRAESDPARIVVVHKDSRLVADVGWMASARTLAIVALITRAD